jgi:hypothetical protein
MFMNPSRQSHDIAEAAHQLRRAAAEFEQSASAGATSAALPDALEDLKETLELLAMGVEKAAEAIEEGDDPLAPRASALRWHLSHLSARLLGARDACPGTRRWARELLDDFDVRAGERRQRPEPVRG